VPLLHVSAVGSCYLNQPVDATTLQSETGVPAPRMAARSAVHQDEWNQADTA
jgi:hypothetical protein